MAYVFVLCSCCIYLSCANALDVEYRRQAYNYVVEGLDRMVLTSGMCTGRFGSYGAYKWHVYWKVWIVWWHVYWKV